MLRCSLSNRGTCLVAVQLTFEELCGMLDVANPTYRKNRKSRLTHAKASTPTNTTMGYGACGGRGVIWSR